MKIQNKEEHLRSDTKRKTIVNYPNNHSIKKGIFSAFYAEGNPHNKEKMFLDDFDLGMEFKVYFPQFNFAKILQKLNYMIELSSPIHNPKIKSPRRLFQKNKILFK